MFIGESKNRIHDFLRLIARGSDAVCLAVIILFLIGQDLMFGSLSVIEWIGLLFFPLGVFVGLVFAWREELLGGLLIISSVAGFYFIYGWLLNHELDQGWAFLLFLIPGLLFISDAMINPRDRHALEG